MHIPQSARIAALAAAIWAAVSIPVFAGDPGELFPDVAAYDDKVSAPVSRPESDIKRATQAAPDVSAPAANPVPAEPPANPTAPAEIPSARPVSKDARWVFHPYSVGLLAPFLDPADQQTFDQQYAERISKALAGKLDERRKASAELAAAAAAEKSFKLKRYLLLHSLGLAIRGAAPVAERGPARIRFCPCSPKKPSPSPKPGRIASTTCS